MQPLPLKLAPGSDLRLSLEELAQRDGISGFVLGVVGNLTKASFQCPGQAEPTVLEGDLEVITLNGTFSPRACTHLRDGACHLHHLRHDRADGRPDWRVGRPPGASSSSKEIARSPCRTDAFQAVQQRSGRLPVGRRSGLT